MTQHFNLNFDGFDLEGRVLVYAKLNNCADLPITLNWCGKLFHVDSFETCFFGSYVTTDLNDFKKKAAMGEEQTDTPKNKADSIANEKSSTITPNSQNKCYRHLVHFYSTADIAKYCADTIYAGEHEFIDGCIQSIEAIEKFYLLRMLEQRMVKHNNTVKSTPTETTYKNYAGKPIEDIIEQNYVLPLLKARNENHPEQYAALEKNFEKFYKGAPFEKDCKTLYDLIIRGEKGSKNAMLILKYVEKISAINCENYELAKELRDRIEKIENTH